MKKRFFSMLFGLVMVVGLLYGFTMTASAETDSVPLYVAEVNGVGYETINAALEAAQESENATLKLLDDITGEVSIQKGTFTFDLNGHSIINTDGYALWIEGGNIIVTDSSVDKTGIITGETSGVFVFYSGTVVTITGGTITGGYEGVYVEGGTCIISGDTVTGDPITGTGSVNVGFGSCTINGGTHYGSLDVFDDGIITINGGSFSRDPENYVTDGCSATLNSEGLWVVAQQEKVRISAVARTDHEVLAGALLQLIDSEGYVIDEWHSSNSFKLIEGLNPQVSYKLRCVTAPDAYVLPEDVIFSIDADGKITSSGAIDGEGTLLIEFSKTEFFVSAVDLNGVELEGAFLQILDSNGNPNEEWYSTFGTHCVEGLKTQVEYTLISTVAPEGYICSTNQSFVIDESGNVTYTGTVREDGTLLVEFSETEVPFSAVDQNGVVLEGALLQLFDQDRNPVLEWFSNDTEVIVSHLCTGKDYILCCSVSPEGYICSEEVIFTLDAFGKVCVNGEQVDVVEISFTKAAASVTVNGLTTDYSTIGAALEDVIPSTAPDTVVKLLEDVTESIDINSGTFILDLNGYTVFGTQDPNNPSYCVKIHGGNVTVIDSSDAKTGTIGGSTYGLYLNGGVCTIGDVKIDNTNTGVFVNGGDVTVVGGTIKGSDSALFSQAGRVILTGGSFSHEPSKSHIITGYAAIMNPETGLYDITVTESLPGYYPIWVGNEQVREEKLSGDGWSYNPETNILTLENFNNNGEGVYIWDDMAEYACLYAVYSELDLHVVLVGDNTITITTSELEDVDGIYSEGDLTISGTGKIEITAADDGLYAENITIESGTISINALDDDGIDAAGDLTINGGTVIIMADDEGIEVSGDALIYNGTIIVESGSDAIDVKGNITINGGTFELTAALSAIEAGLYDESATLTINGGRIRIAESEIGDPAVLVYGEIVIGEDMILSDNYKVGTYSLEYGDGSVESYTTILDASDNFVLALTIEKPMIPGDINGDELVDLNDALQLFLHVMLPELYPVDYEGSVDFTKDSYVDIRDALYLFRHSMMPDTYPID